MLVNFGFHTLCIWLFWTSYILTDLIVGATRRLPSPRKMCPWWSLMPGGQVTRFDVNQLKFSQVFHYQVDLFVRQAGDRSQRVAIMNLRAPGLLHAPDRLGIFNSLKSFKKKKFSWGIFFSLCKVSKNQKKLSDSKNV